MIQKLLLQLAITLFRQFLLPKIKVRSYKILNDMSDKVMDSDYNPVDKETIGDIRQHADDALDKLFEEIDEYK
jgi:hypothetical protein